MKKIVILTAGFLLATSTLFAASSFDFSTLTNKELFQLRNAVQNAPEDDRKAYQLEWQKRQEAMSEEEKKHYEDTADDPSVDDPKILWTPGRGYEQQGVQGQVIFGGAPRRGGGAQ